MGINLVYAYILDDYIYYKKDPCKTFDMPDHDITKRLIIKNFNDIITDNNFDLCLGLASHNLRLFKCQDKIYGIGGQAEKIFVYNNHYSKTINQKYIDYHNHNHNIFINMNDTQIYNPNNYCPYYANGLHLYLFNNSHNLEYKLLNNNLPIISGIEKGRTDYIHRNSINEGLTTFDSISSILYHDGKYYLYQRANIDEHVRYIQYTTSIDLLSWTEFKLINEFPNINIHEHNYYYNNFFKMEGINNYIGILPCCYKNIAPVNSPRLRPEQYKLYYSSNCTDWFYIGVINNHYYYKSWIVNGEPIISSNRYYFYIEQNRFSYAYTIEDNKYSFLKFKLMSFPSRKIAMNFKTGKHGYINMQLKNSLNQIIDGYSFNEFKTIQENMNEFDYLISWNNTKSINYENIYIELEGINFHIYSINCLPLKLSNIDKMPINDITKKNEELHHTALRYNNQIIAINKSKDLSRNERKIQIIEIQRKIREIMDYLST